MSGDELDQIRREFAAMLALLDSLGDNPTGPEAVRALGQVRAFMQGERRGALTPLLRLAAADLYYLEGYTQQQIADLTGVTAQAVSATVLSGDEAPREYTAVRRTGGGRFAKRQVQVRPDRAGTSYRQLREMREQGWRVAPAMWQVDPEKVEAAELWDRLRKMDTQA